MNKGGYQILDFKGVNLTDSVGHVFPGMYDTIEGTKKRKIVSGFVLQDVEYEDTEANVYLSGSDYKLIIPYKESAGEFVEITVTSNDVVTAVIP